MKTLYLLRHAKSSWDDATLSDFDRPLNKRGRRAAPFIGKWMRERGVNLQALICSPAARARETLELVAAEAHFSAAPRFERRIYESNAVQLALVASEIEDEAESALIVGHNYALEEFLTQLTGAVDHLPTAALACVELNINAWLELLTARRPGRLKWLVKPKELMKD